MTKGEQQAYTLIQSSLRSLISEVKSYCRDYNCGRELLKECEKSEEALSKAIVLFMKGKRNKK